MEQQKHRHLYVMRHYLEQWSTGGTMYCRRDGRVFSNNSRNLAVEDDFYKLKKLNTAEIRFLHEFAKTLPQRGSVVINNFLKYFTAHTLLTQKLGEHIEDGSELAEVLKAYESNVEENWHAAIEGTAVSILAELRDGDVSFYKDATRCAAFMYFIALQLLRTKKMADSIKLMPTNNLSIDFKEVWPTQRQMIASNFGCNLFLERQSKPITMIHNKTDVHFITSDHPVINVYPDEAQDNTLAIYYPVSPFRAIIFGDLKADIPRPLCPITVEQVQRLNKAVAAASH